MKPEAKAAYLTALISQSQQREKGYQANLDTADTRHDTVSATARLEREQTRQQELRTERAELAA